MAGEKIINLLCHLYNNVEVYGFRDFSPLKLMGSRFILCSYSMNIFKYKYIEKRKIVIGSYGINDNLFSAQ